MRYWYDTEFLESGPEKPLQLVSIGIVAEDGRELYAQSPHWDFDNMNAWVKENVFSQLTPCPNTSLGYRYEHASEKQLRISLITQSKHCHNGYSYRNWHCDGKGCDWRDRYQLQRDIKAFLNPEQYGKPELWGYYSSYDHVVFAQIFGTMMDLPKGFPMYTLDIKQFCNALGNPQLPAQAKGEHNALEDARWNKQAWEFLRRLKSTPAEA